MEKKIERYYKQPGVGSAHKRNVIEKVKTALPGVKAVDLTTEVCFYVELKAERLSGEDRSRLQWILTESFDEENLSRESWIEAVKGDEPACFVEIGPRLNFSTAWSTNAVSVCKGIGLEYVTRIEKSTRYVIVMKTEGGENMIFNTDMRQKIVDCLHDKMTECEYKEPLETFDIDANPDECYEIDVMNNGQKALIKANNDLGLSFDEWDIEYYTKLFTDQLKRNPSSVECFDLAQSNSEHSRHWFFKGKMIIDNKPMPKTLMKMVMSTQESTNPNSLIKFSDNSR